MKLLTISIVIICTLCFVGCGYRIEQETTKYLNLGYNVDTRIWKGNKIVWAHYTFQEWQTLGRLYIPLDSVPSVKERDYKHAQKMLQMFKEANLKE